VIRRAYVDGRWGQVHLTMAGPEDGPPLVLLHQSPLSGAQFAPALPLLARAGLRAIAVDTAGFGQSDPPPAPASIAEHAEALGLVLDRLGLARAHLLGHHTGAMIAASFAARCPERVGRLVLNGVPLFSAEERAHFATFDFRPIAPLADGSHLLAAWQQRLAATPGWTDLAAMHRHVVAWLANPDRAHWGFQMAFAHDLEADLRAITAPTLILTNSGEDLFAASLRAHALRPDWDFHALVGGTHDVVDEMPEAWAAAVAGFLTG
jgi:pimeloyl-ACP methyl ester carboxylesterase